MAFAKRFVLVGTTSLFSVVSLVVLFAWIALQIPWSIPDVRSLTGPSEIYAADGTLLARFTSEVDREVVPLEQVSQAAIDAILTSEDARFYEHEGVDPLSLLRAVVANVRTGGIAQGGSTLTQQYVKNAYEGVGSERTLLRKVREAVIAIQLERNLGCGEGGEEQLACKNQILEDYLNAIYFGEGAYGIEAAAITYFNKSASELTHAEGALLAQTIPGPSVRNPRADPVGADVRADRLINRMFQLGLLDSSEHRVALAAEPRIRDRVRPPVREPFVVEYVRRQLVANFGEEAVLTGRLRVTTTIDLETQQFLREAVEARLPVEEAVREEGVDPDTGEPIIKTYDAGAVAIDPRTGAILGMYGGRDFDTSQVNLATSGIRQPGSTFKPFTFMAALEQGRRADELVRAPSSLRPRDCFDANGNALFVPSDEPISGGAAGRITLEDALARSVNTVFAQLGCDVGPEAIIDLAKRLGVRNPIEANPEEPRNSGYGNIAFGGQQIGPTVLDMASAYATIANDGILCPAHIIASVTDAAGVELEVETEYTVTPGGLFAGPVPDWEQQPRVPTQEQLDARPDPLGERDGRAEDGTRCYEAVDADITRTAVKAMKRVVAETTGKRADIGREQAGKTGTTNEEVDAWFSGITPDLSLTIWVGDVNGNTPMRNLGGFRKVQGGTIPAQIWKLAAERILEDVPPSGFPEPGEIVFGPGDGRKPAPARPRPRPTVEPEPEPTEPEPTEPEPTASETNEPDPEPEPSETDGGGILDPGGGGGGDDDDGGGDDDNCLLVFCP